MRSALRACGTSAFERISGTAPRMSQAIRNRIANCESGAASVESLFRRAVAPRIIPRMNNIPTGQNNCGALEVLCRQLRSPRQLNISAVLYVFPAITVRGVADLATESCAVRLEKSVG